MTRFLLMTRNHSLGLGVVLAAGAALAIALWAQYFDGLSPCALCLIARWPYRFALVLGASAMILPYRAARWALWLALLCFIADIGVGVVHTGVEFGWWKSPLSECSAPALNGLSGSALLAAMPTRPVTPCDAVVYLIPGIDLSMAMMNLIYAAFCSAGLAGLLIGKTRP